MQYLEFEKDIEELEGKIGLLRDDPAAGSTKEILTEIDRHEKVLNKRLKEIYRNLDGWQTCMVARHPERPHTMDLILEVFTDFQELHGDRMYADDSAIVGGLARLDGEPVMVIGHQKGRGTEERITNNWGMPHPEGYRKAMRLMDMAANFNLPLITMIDTPGAFCGVGAEERGMSQAIGSCLVKMANLRTRIIATVIGEGGSGGALAIGVCDELLMFEHSVYSVISPEGCASILWKNGDGKAVDAAKAMRLRTRDLIKLNLVDQIIPEPIGGAHRDPIAAAKNWAQALTNTLGRLNLQSLEDCLAIRAKRLRNYGVFTEKRY